MARSAQEDYRIEALAKEHSRQSFSCGNKALDRYLREQATQDAKRRVAAPFVLTAPPSNDVIGYYTLSAASVNVAEWPEDVVKKLPRYPLVPVTLLGQLALDEKQKGRGLGEFLLTDALHRSLEAAGQVGSVAVIVDAIDDAAEKFYAHYGFIPFPKLARRLFLPIQTIAKLF